MKLSKTILTTTAIIAFASLPAVAQNRENIDQVNLGSVWTDLNVKVNTSATDVVAAGSAVANAATVSNTSPDRFIGRTEQVNKGEVGSDVFVWAGDVSNGTVASSSTAVANSSSAGSWYSSASTPTRQVNTGNVTALNAVDVEDSADISANSTAVANLAEVEADFGGHLEARRDQINRGDAFAGSTITTIAAQGRTDNVAVAVGNSGATHVQEFGDAWATPGAQINTSSASVVASAETNVTYSASDIVTAAAASGNQTTVSSVDSLTVIGHANNASFNQTNKASVFSDANTFVDHASGFVTNSAAGVGNALDASILRGVGEVRANQNNTGDVGSSVILQAGTLGGGGIATSQSLGNSFSAIGQDAALSASVNQRNTAHVSASTSVQAGFANSIVGSATAIGNTATIERRATNTGK